MVASPIKSQATRQMLVQSRFRAADAKPFIDGIVYETSNRSKPPPFHGLSANREHYKAYLSTTSIPNQIRKLQPS